jgi:hypothetical protein
MNATNLAAAAKKATTPAAIMSLIQQVDPRVAELRRQIADIAPSGSPLIPHPPARLAALREGLDAVRRLDDQIREHEREIEYLSHLHGELYEAHARALVTEARAAVPRAKKALPRALALVRERLAGLDDALAALNTELHELGRYADADLPPPLDDAEQVEILELRERLWQMRTLDVLYHDDRAQFPRSWALLHAVHAGGLDDSGAYHVRRGPQIQPWPDGEPVASGSAGRW